MKRKASMALGSHCPAKLSKESTIVTVDKKLKSVKVDTQESVCPEPVRSSSFRQRKAPSWMSSYVTSSSQKKEIKKSEQPKLKIPKFPTLVPPSKRVKGDSKGEKNQENETEPSITVLRKQPTLKLETNSPPVSSTKVKKKPLVPTPSLTRKSTEILSSSDDSDSGSKKTAKSKDIKKESESSSAKGKKMSKSSRAEDIKKDCESSSVKVEKVSKSKSAKDSKSLSAGKTSSNSKTKNVKLPGTISSRSISKPSKRLSRFHVVDNKNINEETVSDDSKVVEICDPSNNSNSTPSSKTKDSNTNSVSASSNFKTIPVRNNITTVPHTFQKTAEETIILNEQSKPNMLEVVICISTSGALREYLVELQNNIREMIWRLQSLVPNLRIGVMAHTQGGIHDDPTKGSFSVGDHNYNRTGGHSGTKWLDLGATLSQICAFVDSLELESTVYPDYVQDNLEMALWKLQRCMSWSSCSYRSVVMIGRGRPNRTTFYHQKEHWRGWIRSALELPPSVDIPVIDWELEAKILAEMGIHVFTIQAVAGDKVNNDEDEGTAFFRRVAEITQGQHVRINNASKLLEIMIGIFCACHGSELLLDHRDTVRDENDGVLPSQLTNIFVGLQLHSMRSSLSSLPSMLRNLDLAGVRQRLNGYSSRIESSMDVEEIREEELMDSTQTLNGSMTKIKSVMRNEKVLSRNVKKVNGVGKMKEKPLKSQKRFEPYKVNKKKSDLKCKGCGVMKHVVKSNDRVTKVCPITKPVKTVTKNNKTLDKKRKVPSLNMLANRGSSKRKIKVSEKVKETLYAIKKGRVNKKRMNSSPLKREAVKAVIKSQVKGKKIVPSSRVSNKNKVGKTKTEQSLKSSQTQSGVKRRVSVVKSSPRQVNSKGLKSEVVKGRYNKVSPLNRKKSVTKLPLKTALSKRKSTAKR